MESIKWSQDMELGIDELDMVHKALVDDVTALLATPDDKFGPAFQKMVANVEKDFHDEEELMEKIDYPGLPEHREQHARVLSALHHVAPHVMDGNIALGREAAELLPQWFLFHLSTMDTELAFALDSAGSDIKSGNDPARGGTPPAGDGSAYVSVS